MRDSIYTPGAGHRPPLLAGRDEFVRDWRLMLNDVDARGRVRARDTILLGPRGIGKTATVLAFSDLSREQGYEVVNLQAASGNATLVDSLVRQAARRADAGAGPWQRAKRTFDRIAAINVSAAGFGAGISTHPADQSAGHPVAPEDLADALSDLDREVRRDEPHGGVLITVDEMQNASAAELSMFAAAVQRLNTDHADAHVVFAGSALPHLYDVLEAAHVTHADRLFVMRSLPLTLEAPDARYAIVEPARNAQVAWEPDAADLVATTSNGYPAHLQLFADHAWTAAEGPSITFADAQVGVENGARELGDRVLGPRLDRLSARQIELLAALAVNGGRASTAEVTITLSRASPNEYSRTRDELLTRGDIYAPVRGEMAVSMPVMTTYVLDHYEEVRARSSTPILSLQDMRANVEAIRAQRATQAAIAASGRYVPSRYGPPTSPADRASRSHRSRHQ